MRGIKEAETWKVVPDEFEELTPYVPLAPEVWRNVLVISYQNDPVCPVPNCRGRLIRQRISLPVTGVGVKQSTLPATHIECDACRYSLLRFRDENHTVYFGK